MCTKGTPECITCRFYEMCNTKGKKIYINGLEVARTGGGTFKQNSNKERQSKKKEVPDSGI